MINSINTGKQFVRVQKVPKHKTKRGGVMKTLHVVSLLLIISMISGCDSESLVSPDENNDLSLQLLTEEMYQAENAAIKSVSKVYTFSDMEEVGSSVLNINDNGVSFNLKTTGLTSGNAYTLWLVVFNNPDGCNENGCNGDEFEPENAEFFAAAMIDVIYGTGHIVGGSGKATFSGHQKAGNNSGSIFGPDSYGLIDSKQAEIHLIVRDHGPKIPGNVRRQISEFEGPNPEDCLNGEACQDVQFAVHPPESE